MNNSLMHDGRYNVADFIDIAKDRVTDWIYYHHRQPNRKYVVIKYLSYIQGQEGIATATYLDRDFAQYTFYVNFRTTSLIYLNVIDLQAHKLVTNRWDGMSNALGFDKKGYSYELTTKEYEYLQNAKLWEGASKCLIDN